ncbi:acyltransferase family protein [Sphingobium sufflavum]|uniref:acyltransferase family protein n=1 Tax=Sphingobium sufflavum TaxID=1129547 RepID=UPI001F30B702|nr:acyltransferase [Sphingobium sufflavum]
MNAEGGIAAQVGPIGAGPASFGAAGAGQAGAGQAGQGAARQSGSSRIISLEIGRGLAALAVVVFHANSSARHYGGPSFEWLSVLEHGVDFFFVLSGFIIYTACIADFGHADRIWLYAKKRFVRLFPVLWLVVLGYAAIRSQGAGAPDPNQLLRSLLPYPSLEPTLPLVVWTLRHELIFYAAFPLVIAWPRLGGIVMAGWALACLGQLVASVAGQPVTGVASLFLSSFTLDFMMGMLAARYCHRDTSGPQKFPLLLGCGVLAIALITTHVFDLDRLQFSDYVTPVATVWTLILGMAFTLVVYGLVKARVSNHGEGRALRFLTLLGSASYALYLVHTPANAILQRIAVHLPAPVLAVGGGHLFLILGGTAAGIALHLWLELPLTRWLRKHLL